MEISMENAQTPGIHPLYNPGKPLSEIDPKEVKST